VIENDRGQLSADFTFLENHDILPSRKKGNDDAIVDAIMESVVVRHSLLPGAPSSVPPSAAVKRKPDPKP